MLDQPAGPGGGGRVALAPSAHGSARIEHDHGVGIVRVAVALLAFAVCAWFALGVVQTRDTDRAAAIVSSPGTLGGAAAAHAASLLADAGTLNPDAQVKLLRAQLANREGHPAAARAIVLGVLAGEPQNIDAWVELARSSQGDPHTFALALRRARALAPLVPPPT